ncbi:DUF87 domain-containing protein [Methanospirillum purgamenti]|jgi:hypothetical protein|uniref:DUF87 domain-containing protein n=1 Tax=Methanospirillum hungatei TaxID=2203 RepID=A0A8F5VMK0_METHU|nr:DUF87 domain-containing protein [Methanospirillum hungatei]QXO95569.1 DUF87 domain-containing protein [Methanospirillum hungatei]
MNLKTLSNDIALQNHPIRVLINFLEDEQRKFEGKDYAHYRFVGFVLEIGYNTATIVTSDAFKIAVGGIPRNSLLIMVPAEYTKYTPHFSLLRVDGTADEPLKKEKQQTYFELHKKSMPELDVFTQSELQWGALKTSFLGMYYPHPELSNVIEFSGDLNNIVSAHKYFVYSPSDELLDLIINSIQPSQNLFEIGKLRFTECRLKLPDCKLPNVPVIVSTDDFKGTRTAMFGKTRTGKSNIVKIIAESLIKTTHLNPSTTDKRKHSVGQVIFDINGEYANDNPQDDSTSLASAYSSDCDVYAITPKENTVSKPLRLDFYSNPDISHHLLGTLIREKESHLSNYISSFLSVEIPSFASIQEMGFGDRTRANRKILMYWAILHKAGFPANFSTLQHYGGVNPRFGREQRLEIYEANDRQMPENVTTLDELLIELQLFAERNRNSHLPRLESANNNPLFDSDDEALLEFLVPRSQSASGPRKILPYRIYHDKDAANFVTEILNSLSLGKTIILDLSNAHPEVMNYFSQWLSKSIFEHQVELFSENKLSDHYIQLYFEEAHNLFPSDDSKVTSIYNRISKEGAKYHLGMVYSTQSPSTISQDLLAQTENFFVTHISSRPEVDKLARLNVAYEGLIEDILQTKTQGYVRILTRSNRFVIPIQANKFCCTESTDRSN